MFITAAFHLSFCMNFKKDIGVIGAGVNGLSCAILLQQAGYDVTIISKDDPRANNALSDYASFFPSASIIPHSVFSESLISLFQSSLGHFKRLHQQKFTGLSINEHYELYGFQKPIPAYAHCMDNFSMFDDFKNQWHPKHPTHPARFGWSFDCFFADWSLYFPALLNLFLENGGKLELRTLTPDEIADLPFEIIINCAGSGAAFLFDEAELLLYRGHLLQVLEAPVLTNKFGVTVSYNFSPHLSNNDADFDVYCYPRKDGWILGGSRQKGTLDSSGNWSGEPIPHETAKLNDTAYPKYIEEMNREIIFHSFGINMDEFSKRNVKVGYRYVRSVQKGIRLEPEERSGKLIIHNYGHGGAGVTLSWGCAQRVLNLLQTKIA